MAKRKRNSEPTRSSARLRRQKDKENAQPLADLPPELLLQVADYLSLDDRRSLSSINSQFRQFLAPQLFHTLRADNIPVGDGLKSMERIVVKYGKHVKQLIFIVYLDAGEQPSCSVHATPSTVWDLLDGRALPNVETLRFYFYADPDDFAGIDWNDGATPSGRTILFSSEESMDHVRRKERKLHWRALYNECLGAISLRAKPLKRLDLGNFPLKKCTVQTTRQWEILLNGLEVFKIDLWGEGDEDGLCSNTQEPYLKGIEELQDNFFQHLTSAKHVQLAAHWANPVGGQFLYHTPVPLAPADLPQVEHLELQLCFIDDAFVEWLKTRHNQLRSLHLAHCFAASEYGSMAEGSVTWAAFFGCVRKSQPMLDGLTFQTFQYCPHHEDPSQKPTKFDPYAPLSLDGMSAVEKSAFRLSARLMSDRLPFKYKFLDDESGMVCANTELSVKRCCEGDDQKEFTALVNMVENNKRKAGRA